MIELRHVALKVASIFIIEFSLFSRLHYYVLTRRRKVDRESKNKGDDTDIEEEHFTCLLGGEMK